MTAQEKWVPMGVGPVRCLGEGVPRKLLPDQNIVTLVALAQRTFLPRRLIVPLRIAPYFQIHSFSIGANEVLIQSPLPAETFSETGWDERMLLGLLPALQIGMVWKLGVRNVCRGARLFSATLWGEQI